MREIKFRAWWQHPLYNEDGGMYGVAGIVWGTPDDGEPEYKLSLEPVQVALVDYPLVENYQKLGWNKQCKLMQYTGLKDKNGVEIYEGDIVTTGNGLVRLVTWDAPGFWLAKNPTDRVDVDSFSTPGSYEEVIGNIYSNPELLGGTDDTTNTPTGAEKE